MNPLKLGDLVLDPRRALFISSLKTLVISDLHDALALGSFGSLRDLLGQVDSLVHEYTPESLILIGDLDHSSLVANICKRWGKQCTIQFVCENPKDEILGIAEAFKVDLHKDLIWGRYRFLSRIDLGNPSLEVQLMTIAAIGSSSEYSLRVGNAFSGIKLSLFLKGIGTVLLPSINPQAVSLSILGGDFKKLERFDSFAVGHHRVLPMGKVKDLHGVDEVGSNRYLMVKHTLGMIRKASISEETL